MSRSSRRSISRESRGRNSSSSNTSRPTDLAVRVGGNEAVLKIGCFCIPPPHPLLTLPSTAIHRCCGSPPPARWIGEASFVMSNGLSCSNVNAQMPAGLFLRSRSISINMKSNCSIIVQR